MTSSRSTPRPEGRPRAAWAGLAACLWLALVLLLALPGARSAAPAPADGRASARGDDGGAALPAGHARALRTVAASAPAAARRAPPGDGGPALAGSGQAQAPRPVRVVPAHSGTHAPAPGPRTCERLPYHATAPPARSSRTA